MNKLIKTTALFIFLLLFCSAAFGGGFEKILKDAPIALRYPTNDWYQFFSALEDYNTMLPTNDGGVLIFGSEDYYSGSAGFKHRITKLDKFGNYVFDKFIHEDINDALNNIPRIEIYHGSADIFNVIEIKPNTYTIEHRGKYYLHYKLDSLSGNITLDTTYDHFNIRYFTTIDKYGNIISTVYDLRDTIGSPLNSNPYINEVMSFDSVNNKIEILSIRYLNGHDSTYEYGVNKNIYDTSFKLLSQTAFNISVIHHSSNNLFFQIDQYTYKKNNAYYTQASYHSSSTVLIKRDSLFNLIYNIDIDKLTSKDSLETFVPNYYLASQEDDNINILDSYFDKDDNIFLFYITSVLYRQIEFPINTLKKQILNIIKIDKFGNKSTYKLIDVTCNNLTNRQFIGASPLLIFPNKNNLSLLLLNFYTDVDWIKFDINLETATLLSIKNIKSSGDKGYKQNKYSELFWRRAFKLKSPYDNGYFSNFAYSAGSNTYATGIIKFDSLGNTFPHIIQGNVFADVNNNCTKNAVDNSIPQITVTAQNNHLTNFTSSDNNGNYAIGLSDSGLYTVTAQPNINYPLFVQGNCTVQTSYAYLDSFTIDTINLNLKPTILCPNMYVDISTPMLRRCFSNIYTVNYKNNGTIAAPNTYIDVALDRFLTVNSASIAYTNLGNNVLRFNIGNVDYLSSGRFTIDVTVSCDSTILGQTHCVEAHIYPDTVCAVAGYTGPVISAFAACKHDSVEFRLRNSGGNMQNQKRYIVIEDNLNRMNGTFQLNTGQQKIVTIATDSGRTYGIIAEQDDAFPNSLGDKFASAFIEGCNPINGTFHTGFMTQYPEYDGEPFRSVDCQQSRGSYDPNDKMGYPNGVAANHYIEKNTAIDYKINFQNTGNDTAFKVVIVDTISNYLDINTIEPGTSSHRYTFMRTDSNTIKFIFDSIKLVDSNKNEKLSHGFVKFRIQQKTNNPNGTKIFNTAEIYFDYNAPIFTNKTMHTIGDVYVRIISQTINPAYSKADLKVYPNPFRDKTTIELQNIELQKTKLILIDITGKEILQQQSDNNQYEINGNDLAKGFYLFRIQNDKTEIANGKLIVQ